MVAQINLLQSCLPNFGKALLMDLQHFGIIKNYSHKDFIVKQGQNVRYLPIVLKGNVKVYSQEDGLQFLLYYIQQGQSCIFSFTHLFNEKTIEFSAISEYETTILLVPAEKAKEWVTKYPAFNHLILNEFQKHYNDLLHTTKQIICYKIEDRLWEYLKIKRDLENSNTITISHRAIAEDLGTTREVISRLMKKLAVSKKIKQENRSIIIL